MQFIKQAIAAVLFVAAVPGIILWGISLRLSLNDEQRKKVVAILEQAITEVETLKN